MVDQLNSQWSELFLFELAVPLRSKSLNNIVGHLIQFLKLLESVSDPGLKKTSLFKKFELS